MVLAVALAFAVAAVTAGTSAASHQDNGRGGPNDFAVGSVTTKFPESHPFNAGLSSQKFRFSAHSGPAGENPKGYVVTNIPTRPSGSIRLKGHVTCLHVSHVTYLPGPIFTWRAAIEAELDEPIHFGTQEFTYVGIVAEEAVQSFGVPVFVEPLVAPNGPPLCTQTGFKFDGEDHGNVTIHNAAP